MSEQDRALDSPGLAGAQPGTSPPERQPPVARSRPEQELLIVELAWLVIEGAHLFQRLRRILVRI
jgi:hypothetical protein